MGALFGFHLNSNAAGTPERLHPFDAWIRILPDGRIVLLVAKAEMGQGVWTALPMVLAEELDVEWSRVEVQQAPVDPLRYDHLTVGSNSVQSLWLPRRAKFVGRPAGAPHRYIHRMQKVKPSRYVPREGAETPLCEWKRIKGIEDTLRPAELAAVEKAGKISQEQWIGRIAAGDDNV